MCEHPVNKAVIWCEHMVVGFSGMAFTDSAGQCTTSEWITEPLRGARTVGDAAQSLVLAGNELMANRKDDELRKHTMVLAGAPPGVDRNLLYCISNVEHPAQPANRYFHVNTMNIPLHQGEYRYHTTGVLIDPDYQMSYEKELSRIHKDFGANHAAKRMIAMQRRILEVQLRERLGSSVGMEAMVAGFPQWLSPNQLPLLPRGLKARTLTSVLRL